MTRFAAKSIDFNLKSWTPYLQKCAESCKDLDVVFWISVWENIIWSPGMILQLSNAARTINPDIKIILVTSYRYLQKDHITDEMLGVDRVVYIEFFAISIYDRLYRQKLSQPVDCWKMEKKQCLFLTGKPNKHNRLRLLYLLFNKGLKDRLIWSLFMPPRALELSRAVLPELTVQEIDEFIQQNLRNPDGIKQNYEHTSCTYHGVPFDTTLYRDCWFQLISETQFNEPPTTPFITEKTWLAIANHRPFIMATSPGTLRLLKSLGFRTFDQYLAEPGYDMIKNHDQRLHAIVENVATWFETMPGQEEDIRKDIEHNFQRFQSLVQESLLRLRAVFNEFGVKAELHELMHINDSLDQAFVAWYENIRDPSWPDVKHRSDFDHLPAWIQQEMIENFDYYIPTESNP